MIVLDKSREIKSDTLSLLPAFPVFLAAVELN